MVQARTWRNLLLWIHIVATTGALGIDAVLLALAMVGQRALDPIAVYPAAALVGTWLLAPAALTSLATGLLLTRITSFGIARNLWVAAKLAITVTLNGALFFGLLPRLQRVADAAADPQGPASADQAFLVLASSGGTLLLAAAVGLAVFKPDWPARSASSGAAGAPENDKRLV
jgi:hypothetical protein